MITPIFEEGICVFMGRRSILILAGALYATAGQNAQDANVKELISHVSRESSFYLGLGPGVARSFTLAARFEGLTDFMSYARSIRRIRRHGG
jgi:hypothetical protein